METLRVAAPFVAEVIGTYTLVLTIGCNVLSGQPIFGGLSIACALMVMIYALGNISGANFNPAVSLALGITEKMPWERVGKFMGCQLFGGILAGFTYLALFGRSFQLGPAPGHNIVEAGLAEMFYTFMLCFVVLNVVPCEEAKIPKNDYYGIAIGFVIVAGAYSGGSISMGCFNPAVAFAIDVSSAARGFGHCLTYTVCEFVGAGLAAVMYWVVRNSDCKHFKVGEMTSKLVAEFIGTFMLVLTVGLNVLSGSTAAVLSIASSLMCMIYALGGVSGANFNPAVTVAIVASGRAMLKPVPHAVAYIGVQILAGICAGFTYAFMNGGKTFGLKPDTSSWPQAMFGEFVFTFVLAFVVLSVATVADSKKAKEFFGFAIGACVLVGGLAIGKLSGGSLNPAVSIGIATSHVIGGGKFYACLIYTAVELLAGVAAAAAFFVVQQAEGSDEYPKGVETLTDYGTVDSKA